MRVMRGVRGGWLVVLVSVLLGGCGAGGGDPWQARINQALESPEQVTAYPEFSVVLLDMEKQTTSGKPRYYHRYKLIYATGATPGAYTYQEQVGDWQEVPPARYQAHVNNLGMTLVAKKDGEITRTAQPPGYQYVGDPRYGEWKTDARGSSFWSFYGKYMFFSQMFSMLSYGPVFRSGWDDYATYRRGSRPYYGRDGREFGTRGSGTRTAYKGYFGRQKLDPRARSRAFESKVASRVSRSRMSPVRSRSGGFGK
jgi:hypothetical protein